MKKQAINTRTQEEYDALMRYYESKGIKWVTGRMPLENDRWKDEEENTCVFLENGKHGEGITYCTPETALDLQMSILPYTEFAKANIDPDYKAKYEEAVMLLEAIMRIEDLWVPEYPVSEKHMGEAQALYNMAAKIDQFLTNHKDGE